MIPMSDKMRLRIFPNGLWAGLFVLLAFSTLQAQLTEYDVGYISGYFGMPTGITAGPDGALWFTAVAIGQITTSGTTYVHPLPNPASSPGSITAGPDGALWFTDAGTNSIGRITTSGSIAEYPLPTAKSGPQGITAGPDGALWFTEYGANNIGRITTSGSITEYPLPTARSQPYGITAGPDGALWFTELRAVGLGAIGRITTSGSIIEYPNASGYSITAGPDGALWFAGGGIGRITTAGSVTEYPVPTTFGGAEGITAGPDGALWFTVPGDNHVGRIATSGSFSYYVTLPSLNQPLGITTGPDGALWFTENASDMIGRYLPGPPPPQISSLSPASSTEGGSAFTLTVNGKAFTSDAVVEWNGSSLSTTFVSATELTASVPAAFIAEAGNVAVTVVADGFASNTATFIVNGPGINFLNPASASEGGPAFTLAVNGTGFDSGAAVNWNGSPLPTNYVNSAQLTASVAAALISAPGKATVTVISGGVTSNSAIFTVTGPTLNSVNPASVTMGGPAFTLMVDGSGFTSGTVIDWNGSPLPTTYVSAKQLSASVSASLIAAPGTATVTAMSGGVTSNSATVTITVITAPPAINALNPPSVQAGSPALTMTVSGSGFTSGAVVDWNGSPLSTTFLDSTEVIATVPANLIASPGTATITVALGNGSSVQAKLTITPPGSSSCTNIGGNWNGSESGSYTETISAAVETDTATNPINGSGSTTITQTGCSISYNPIRQAGLIGLTLTPSQVASLTRIGTVSGNNVTVTGLLAVIDTVGSALAGFYVTSVSSNTLTATGQVTGNVITLNETGNLMVSGIYSINGQTGPFTETITTSSTATFTRVGITTGGIITTIAGNGTGGFSGDGGPATSAELNNPQGLAVDASGNLFVADYNNNRVREVSASGIITTVAGNGTQGFSGDGGPATSAALYRPKGVAVDSSGNLFIADTFNGRIRKVSLAGGIIATVAGGGSSGLGDGGPATLANLSVPTGLAVDPSGNLFIAEYGGNRIREVAASGTITTIAGNGAQGFSGDGGPAASAMLNGPSDVALDASGNLFIADTFNNRIRKISASGIITTVAGNGTQAFSGDGGSATAAELFFPSGVAVDASGNLYIGDQNNHRVRQVSASGIIATVAGDGSPGFSGDGGPATSAELSSPDGLAVNASGNLFISDAVDNRIREVSASSEASPNITSVGNGASFAQSFAPGMLMSVFGTGLSTGSSQTVTTAPLPLTSLSGTAVTINGISAPLLYISATQINLQIPYDLSPGNAVLTVNAGGQSASISFTVRAAAPGIFVDSKTGHMVPNESASTGSTIGFFLTGAGEVTPSEATGNVPDEGTTPVPTLPLTMTVGGVPVKPVYAAIPDWSVGVLQINFTVPATLAAGTYPVVVTIGGVSSPAALLTVAVAGGNSQCTDIGGNWNASESGSANFSIVAPIETDYFTDPISGGGSVTITQTDCSIQYEPIGESGLIGTNLTPSQLASVIRTGTVSGNNVTVTGLLALVDTVAATQAGLTITNVSSNLLTASGQITGNVMTLTETGNFDASGTYSLNGQTGSFTLTITSSSTATFDWASGTRPNERTPALRSRTYAEPPSLAIVVVPDQRRSSGTGENISGLLRNALQRALILTNR